MKNKALLLAALMASIATPAYAQEVSEAEMNDEAANADSAVDPMTAEASDVSVPAAATPVATVAPAPKAMKLGSGTPIKLVVTNEVNSSTHDEGDIFPLTVLEDVKIDDQVVIPRGTPASAEITWRTGKGAFGKSGKMEFAMQSINLDGQQMPIKGEYRQEGEGNTIATGIGILAVGVFAGFITGKRARLPAGRELMSQLVTDVPFDSNGKIASSYDSNAEMKRAMASTEIGQCKLAAMEAGSAKQQKKAKEKCYSKRLE